MGGGGVFDVGYLSARPASWHSDNFAFFEGYAVSQVLYTPQSLRNNSWLFFGIKIIC